VSRLPHTVSDRCLLLIAVPCFLPVHGVGTVLGLGRAALALMQIGLGLVMVLAELVISISAGAMLLAWPWGSNWLPD
jgi:hypothetical protein